MAFYLRTQNPKFGIFREALLLKFLKWQDGKVLVFYLKYKNTFTDVT
jgi:hypothetical protein